MPSVQIKDPKAADPGVGFIVDLSEFPTDSSGIRFARKLKIVVKVYDDPGGNKGDAGSPHTCEIFINPPITDEKLVVVLPFGCSKFSDYDKVKIMVWVKEKLRSGKYKNIGTVNPMIEDNVQALNGTAFTYDVTNS